MTGMLQDGMLTDFDGMPVTLNANSLDDGTGKSYMPLDTTMSHN
jgi:hypothetical protein